MLTWHPHHTLCSPSPIHHHSAFHLYYARWFPAHESTLIDSFEMSSHWICLGWHRKFLCKPHPDLIQRPATIGILGVSTDISSAGSIQSSQWGCSHGTHQNYWFFLPISSLSCPPVALIFFAHIARTHCPGPMNKIWLSVLGIHYLEACWL